MLSASELKWLTYAVDESLNASHSQWRVGAVLVRSGRVLSVGVNRYRNNPSKVDIDGVSYHAEEVAIRRAGNADGATIYVARMTRSGKIGLARPCRRCQALLLENGVQYAIWTEPNGWGKARINRLIDEQFPDTSERPADIHPLFARGLPCS
jgi:tRNA(Arg) A34 adenosine deaminase TadA